ncbi:MAG TPA: hypothetical protein VHZ75_01895 [Solirubrobacteraceae bacterium]|nr:hypothetical protein [Solirubrobacteraceae bacterium]
MRRTLLSLLIAAIGSLSVGATADLPPQPLDTPLQADLDGDGSPETVRAHEIVCYGQRGRTAPPCAKDVLRSLYVEVTDHCAGAAHAIRLSREMNFMSLAQIVDADGDGRARELAFEARAGATGRGVQAKVVAFRPGRGGCVAVRKTLFSYPMPATIGRRPPGTTFASGEMAIKDFAPRLPGLELRTSETYARPADAGCCPTYHRVTYWRFAPGRQAYSPYRTRLTRLKKLTR